MKGKTWAVLLCVILTMALVMSISGALAESAEEPAAISLEQLKEVLRTNGGTYQLSEDITLDSDLFCKVTSTIDLNGYTIHTGDKRIVTYSLLTVKDSSQEQTGKIKGTNTVLQSGMVNAYGRVYSGTLIIQSGTIDGTQNSVLVNAESSLNLYGGTVTATKNTIVNSGGTVNIYGGTAQSTSQTTIQNLAAAFHYEDDTWNQGTKVHGGTLSVSGGTVKTVGEIAIVNETPEDNPDGATPDNVLNVTGGTIIAGTEAVLNKSVASIYGGEISADEYAIVIDEGGEFDIRGGSVHAQDYTVYVAGKTTISGGTVYAEADDACAVYADQGEARISGGTVYTTGDAACTVYVTGTGEKDTGSTSIYSSGTVKAFGADAIGLYLDDYSYAAVSGGTIEAVEEGGCGIYMGSSSVRLILSGGSISAYDCCVMTGSHANPDFFLCGAPGLHTLNPANSDIELLNPSSVISINSTLTNTTPISVRLGGDREGYDVGGVFTRYYYTFHSADDHPSNYFTTVSETSTIEWADESHQEARITGHEHDLVYYISSDGTTLYAVCQNDGCYLNEEDTIFTLHGPDNPIYDGSPKKAVLSVGFLEALFPNPEASIDYYVYDAEEDAWSFLDTLPVNPGWYWAEYTGKADETGDEPVFAGVAFEIEKIPTVATKLPSAYEELFYIDTPVELIEPGIAPAGEFVYAIGEDSETVPDESLFTAEIPEATGAGTYYVWYILPPEDEFHTGIGPVCLEATVIQHGVVQIIAVDKGNGDPMSGVAFALAYWDGEETVYDEWTSDADQPKVIDYLTVDKEYILYTDDVPEGYMIPHYIVLQCGNDGSVWADPDIIGENGILAVEIEAGYDILSDGTAKAVVYDWLNTIEIEQAAPGTEIQLTLCDDPEMYLRPGYYFTGAFTVNEESLGYNDDGVPIESFIMPEEEARISAVQARQKAITLDFSQSNSLAIPYMAFVQMINGNQTGQMFGTDESGNILMDLNRNGIYELAVQPQADENQMGEFVLTLLGEDEAFGRYDFTFDGYDEEYGSIAFIIPAPAFENPTFVLPESLAQIEESAFEGNTGISVVWVSNACEAIGKNAFKGCTGLRQIRLPKDCAIDALAFDGCEKVYVFAAAGGTTEAWCGEHDSCVFVEENIAAPAAE